MLAVGLAVATSVAMAANSGHTSAAACSVKGGVVRAFQTNDLAGIIDGIGTDAYRAEQVWVPIINKAGGLDGCQLAVDQVNEPFPDVSQCLRHYKDAIASNKYAFYLNPVNSGCMAAVPTLTNQVHKVMIAGEAADHEPFLEHFQKYNLSAEPSTLLEARAAALFAAKHGWKRIAILSPAHAFGRDLAKQFIIEFNRVVKDGKIVTQQYPDPLEKNLTPFVNAVVAAKPDAVFGGMDFAAPALYKIWNQEHLTVPTMWHVALPVLQLFKSADAIAPNSYGFIRGYSTLLSQTPTGKQFYKAFVAKYHTPPNEWGYAEVSALQLAQALANRTHSLDADTWIKAVDAGNFKFTSVYANAPISVSPIHHMANANVEVGKIVFDKSLGYAQYQPSSILKVSLSQVLPDAEAKQLTHR
jgi:ABC-type branched-subunit amino acid transport system substrate-binding protein